MPTHYMQCECAKAAGTIREGGSEMEKTRGVGATWTQCVVSTESSSAARPRCLPCMAQLQEIQPVHSNPMAPVSEYGFATRSLATRSLSQARKGARTLAFYTLPEYEAWKESLGATGTAGWDIKYYKGLWERGGRKDGIKLKRGRYTRV